MRTEVIGLRKYLRDRRVPDILSGRCECGTGAETVKHILLYCPLEAEARAELRAAIGQPLTVGNTIGGPGKKGESGAHAAVKWLLRRGRIPQFALSNRYIQQYDEWKEQGEGNAAEQSGRQRDATEERRHQVRARWQQQR